MEFKCCKCGGGIEMGRSFEPIDPKGTENRRWICNVCQGTERKTLNDVLFNETRSEKEQKAKIEMVEYEGDYVPKELCSIDALGGVDDVTEDALANLQKLYPGVNGKQELNKIIGWAEANPTLRKTRRGAPRFLNSWFSRAQDQSSKKGQKQTKQNALYLLVTATYHRLPLSSITVTLPRIRTWQITLISFMDRRKLITSSGGLSAFRTARPVVGSRYPSLFLYISTSKFQFYDIFSL
jgi:hypothetical protein